MNPALVLLVMTHLSPFRAPQRGWDATAALVAQVAQNNSEAALLLTIAWNENTFVTDGTRGVPFGVTCCWRSDWTPERAARFALQIMRAGQGECGGLHRAWVRYYSGSCRVHTPRHETRRHQRMRVRAHRYALRADARYSASLRQLGRQGRPQGVAQGGDTPEP